MKLNAVAKLPESDFEVDPGLREIIEVQTKEEEEAVRQVEQLYTVLYQAHCRTLSVHFHFLHTVTPAL